jgi:MFS family permease
MNTRFNDKQTVITFFALLLSLFAQMQAISLLGLTIPLSLSDVGSSTNTIGQVMALYSVGLVIGTYQGKKAIARVGHIRAFAGFAAIATATAIMHSLTNSIALYGALRVLSGISAAVMLIVIESWFSTLSGNANRSRLFALHQIVFYVAMGSGQLLINLSPENLSTVFLIAAILPCFALMPMSLIGVENPPVVMVKPISIIALIKLAPCGVLGAVCAGNAIGTVFNLSPIYIKSITPSMIDISLFMSAVIFSGALLQRPIGKIADKYSREYTLVLLLLLTAISALIVMFYSASIPLPLLGVFIGAPMGCLYPISAAITYAKLTDDKAVASSSALLLAYATGGFFGPIWASYLMQEFGRDTLFIYIAVFNSLLAVCCVFIYKYGIHIRFYHLFKLF